MEFCKELIEYFQKANFQVSDFVDILSLLVNAFLGIWIVKILTNKLTNKRTLKDHFITEVKELRQEYKTYLNLLYSNKVHPQLVLPWFKLMNIKVDGLLEYLNEIYHVDVKILKPYQIQLRDLITDSKSFNEQFNNQTIEFSEDFKIELIKFQQENAYLFTDLIIQINDCS